jgi:hypothetical protein
MCTSVIHTSIHDDDQINRSTQIRVYYTSRAVNDARTHGPCEFPPRSLAPHLHVPPVARAGRRQPNQPTRPHRRVARRRRPLTTNVYAAQHRIRRRRWRREHAVVFACWWSSYYRRRRRHRSSTSWRHKDSRRVAVAAIIAAASGPWRQPCRGCKRC